MVTTKIELYNHQDFANSNYIAHVFLSLYPTNLYQKIDINWLGER